MIYFDHNATSPLSPQALEAWCHAAANFPGNPSSPHRLGARADAALELAREEVAEFLHCSPREIVWTSGATESNNTVLRHFYETDPASEIWLSAIEHPCLHEPARRYFPGKHRCIPVLRSGTVDLDWIASGLKESQPALICVMAANNETGVLQPWREISRLCHQRGVPFLSDAVQWAGKLPGSELGQCDFLAVSGHKFGGPRGIGILKCPANLPLKTLLRGGNQEDGRRAGTENVPGALAMTAAWRTREKALKAGEHSGRLEWREAFEKFLMKDLPAAEVLGVKEERLWNTVSAVLPALPSKQRWLVKLDKLGFAVSTGSACASGKEKPSHVLKAMGYTEGASDRVIRFSSGWSTTREEWQQLQHAITAVYRAARAQDNRLEEAPEPRRHPG